MEDNYDNVSKKELVDLLMRARVLMDRCEKMMEFQDAAIAALKKENETLYDSVLILFGEQGVK